MRRRRRRNRAEFGANKSRAEANKCLVAIQGDAYGLRHTMSNDRISLSLFLSLCDVMMEEELAKDVQVQVDVDVETIGKKPDFNSRLVHSLLTSMDISRVLFRYQNII